MCVVRLPLPDWGIQGHDHEGVRRIGLGEDEQTLD